MDSAASDSLDGCVRSFGKVLLHIFILIGLLRNHLVYHHVVATCCLVKVRLLLLRILPSAALIHLAAMVHLALIHLALVHLAALIHLVSLLRYGATEALVVVIVIIIFLFFIGTNTFSWLRYLFPVALSCLPSLSAVSVCSATCLSFRLELTNFLYLILHVDNRIV
jgi:hypothetical protein